MINFNLEFYQTENGECPVEDFIELQDIKMQAKIYKMLELLEERGNRLRMPYSEYLGDGIFQIRAQVGNNITRVLYFFFVDEKIILTNGFMKKTQRTPPSELVLAKKYRADYLIRQERKMK